MSYEKLIRRKRNKHRLLNVQESLSSGVVTKIKDFFIYLISIISIIRNFGVLPGEALTIWKGFLRNSNDFFASTTRLSLFLFLHYLKVNFAKFYRETGYKDLKLF